MRGEVIKIPSVFINPLDLRTLIVEYLIGDGVLFPLIFAIVYPYIAAINGFSNRIFFMYLIIGALMFGTLMGEAYIVLVILLLGGFVFKVIAKYFV